jgi:hypothetical protein
MTTPEATHSGAATPLRQSLTGEAAELYDSVSGRYPRFADGLIQRRSAIADDAFRSALRAALDNTATPQGWQQQAWTDREVAETATNPDVLRRLRAVLADEEPGGWADTWTRRNSQDRVMTYGMYVAAAVVVLVVAVWNIFN